MHDIGEVHDQRRIGSRCQVPDSFCALAAECRWRSPASLKRSFSNRGNQSVESPRLVHLPSHRASRGPPDPRGRGRIPGWAAELNGKSVELLNRLRTSRIHPGEADP